LKSHHKIVSNKHIGKSLLVFLCLFILISTSLNYTKGSILKTNLNSFPSDFKIIKKIHQQTSLDTLFTIDDIELEEDSEIELYKKNDFFYNYSINSFQSVNTNEKHYLEEQKYRYKKIRIYIINQVFRN
jgi:hypothetical protein